MKVPGTGLPDLEGRTGRTYGGGRPTCSFHLTRRSGSRNFHGSFAEMLQKAQKASTSRKFHKNEHTRPSAQSIAHAANHASRTSMLLGRHQNVGIGPIYPFNHRVTHDRQSKTEKAAERGILGQNGLSAEAPLPPKPLSMHLGHVPRRGNVYPDTLASTAMHGAWPQGPKSGSKDGGFSTIIKLSG